MLTPRQPAAQPEAHPRRLRVTRRTARASSGCRRTTTWASSAASSQPLYARLPHGADVAARPSSSGPLRWLEAISRFGGTISGGPNFAFDLCVRKITPEERAALDLSRWEVAFSGAEPIRPETLERFAEAFAPQRLPPRGLLPLLRPGRGHAHRLRRRAGRGARAARAGSRRRWSGTGRWQRGRGAGGRARRWWAAAATLADQALAIVDPGDAGSACAPGEVGEIWVRGPQRGAGLLARPEETRGDASGARSRASGDGPVPAHRRPGLPAPDGELFVTGRAKDLIILRGRNHYPQDLELTVEREPPARCAPAAAPPSPWSWRARSAWCVVQEVDARR